jgi:hypothetical protein
LYFKKGKQNPMRKMHGYLNLILKIELLIEFHKKNLYIVVYL